MSGEEMESREKGDRQMTFTGESDRQITFTEIAEFWGPRKKIAKCFGNPQMTTEVCGRLHRTVSTRGVVLSEKGWRTNSDVPKIQTRKEVVGTRER
jgi:hypothetical protein